MIVTAVIPAHNESKHIVNVLTRARQFVDYLVVVDDGSRDNTFALVQALGGNVIALRHSINLGKGAAMKTGCEAAIMLKSDVIVCMDADGQHNPEHIPQFTSILKTQPIDIVFGSREFNNRMPFVMMMGNYLLSAMINWLFHMKIHDSQSGYRAFTSLAYQQLKWDSTGYQAETEMIARASEAHLRYAEIDIETIYHDSYKGTTVIDGLRIFLNILRWKFI